jgi:hypothetical protein
MAGTITPGQKGRATDFINESQRNATPSNDAGRVPKLESDAKLSRTFLRAAFGGNGSDGALTIASGTTTINLGGARVYTLNYSSISITGTGALAFSNPHANGTIIIIKCQGDCTLTSSAAPMINCSNTGASGGVGSTVTFSGSGNVGSAGTDGISYGFIRPKGGTPASITPGANVFEFMASGVNAFLQILAKYPKLWIGAGGGAGATNWSSGGTGTVVGGNGGVGGGCLIMEIGGAINFTTTNGISVAGSPGQNGSHTGNPTSFHASAGGGGGGGSAFIFYNSVTAFTGTVKISGGIGGNSNVGVTLGNTGGCGGGSGINQGGAGIAFSNGAGVDGQKTGGDGGDGLEIHGLNTEFV